MVKRSSFRSSGRSFQGNGVTISLRYSSSPVSAIRRYLTGRGEGGNLRGDRHWLLGTPDLVTGLLDHLRSKGHASKSVRDAVMVARSAPQLGAKRAIFLLLPGG